jgi:long-chain acyl-CoA synthetase
MMWSDLERLHDVVQAIVDERPACLPLDMIDAALTRHASQIAFASKNGHISFSGIDAISASFAAFLQNVPEIRKGDAVAVMLPNSLAFPIACLGTLRTGAMQINVNPNYTPRELLHQLSDSGARTLVIIESALKTFRAIATQTQVRHVVVVPDADIYAGHSSGQPSSSNVGGAQVMDLREALQRGNRLRWTRPRLGGDDIMFLQYTGGTTGLSKGAILTHSNLAANIAQFHMHVFGVLGEGREVFITALPLYHIFALTVNFLASIVIGAKNILITNPSDQAGLVETIRTSKFSVITGVNTLFDALTFHPAFRQCDLSNYRFAMGGGTAIRPSTSQRWEAITGHPIRVGYGLSETSPLVSMQKIEPGPFTPDVGAPVPFTDVIILNGDDEPAGPGEPGELCVRGPQVTRGYWNKPQENAAGFTPTGHLRTGDIAIAHGNGVLEIVDRKKDMILVSGFNVYPNEIEAIVAGHPRVAESVCVGVPDERTGEAVKVFVVPIAGATLTRDELEAFCQERLTGYKVPKQFEIRDAIPKTGVGKLLRRVLRERPA